MTLADQAAITGQDGQVGSSKRPKRRTFTAAYKARILAEFDALPEGSPERGALMRRERFTTPISSTGAASRRKARCRRHRESGRRARRRRSWRGCAPRIRSSGPGTISYQQDSLSVTASAWGLLEGSACPTGKV
jgi:hypothetical protein